jgi:vacuolar-type H+-ATPase subunit E/Vma4
MSLERLLETLERGARAEAERAMDAARGEAEEIRTRTETLVSRRRAEALDAREQALRADAAVRLAAVRRAGRRAVLDARQALLERVRAAARERIVAAESEPASLARRLHAALACLGAQAVEIRCAPMLADPVRALTGDRAGTTVTVDPAAPHALLLRAKDGALEVDASLAGLFDRHWPELAVGVVRELEAAP